MREFTRQVSKPELFHKAYAAGTRTQFFAKSELVTVGNLPGYRYFVGRDAFKGLITNLTTNKILVTDTVFGTSRVQSLDISYLPNLRGEFGANSLTPPSTVGSGNTALDRLD